MHGWHQRSLGTACTQIFQLSRRATGGRCQGGRSPAGRLVGFEGEVGDPVPVEVSGLVAVIPPSISFGDLPRPDGLEVDTAERLPAPGRLRRPGQHLARYRVRPSSPQQHDRPDHGRPAGPAHLKANASCLVSSRLGAWHDRAGGPVDQADHRRVRDHPGTERHCGRPRHTARGTSARDRPWPARYSACCKARTGSAGTPRPDPFAAGLAETALTGPLLHIMRSGEAAALPSPQVVLSCSSSGTTAASDAHPASDPLPEVTGYRTPRSGDTSAGHRAGEGLPSSRRHHQCVPRPIRRGVHHGCNPGSAPLPWPSP